jgi:hypothetical protein
MERKAKFWILVIVVAALCTACSTDNSSGQEDATKPPPQVRVGILPSLTPPPSPIPTETVIAPTLEPTAQVFFWTPPSSDDLANQIDSLMNEIDQGLKSQNTTIKP